MLLPMFICVHCYIIAYNALYCVNFQPPNLLPAYLISAFMQSEDEILVQKNANSFAGEEDRMMVSVGSNLLWTSTCS